MRIYKYINSILPEGFVFDPNTVMSDSFLRTYGDPNEKYKDPVTFTSSAQQKAYEALRATEAANTRYSSCSRIRWW